MAGLRQLNSGDLVAGKYAIGRVLGSGGMAIVYEAVHVRLGQRVAMKMLLPELLERDDIVTRFAREGRAAAQLRSPHVARIFDVDTLPDGTPYMVMELLEGRDLAAELTLRGPLPVEEAVDYVLQACDAMAEAHQQGTVHRDLKPSNLFLAKEGERLLVKVLDFGVSKVTADALALSVTTTRSALGTALYMSPEQVRSAKNVDARTDIWSLGVVLYELLTAQPPFLGDSLTAVAAAIVLDTPEPLRRLRAGVAAELEQVVMTAMEKDREGRFQDIAAFAAALAPFRTRHRSLAAPVVRPHDGVHPVVSDVVGGAAPSSGFAGSAKDVPTPATMPSAAADNAARGDDGRPALESREGALRGEGVTGQAEVAPPMDAAPDQVRWVPAIDRFVVAPTPAGEPRAGPGARWSKVPVARKAAIGACALALLACALVLSRMARRVEVSSASKEASIGSPSVLVGVLPAEPAMKSALSPGASPSSPAPASADSSLSPTPPTAPEPTPRSGDPPDRMRPLPARAPGRAAGAGRGGATRDTSSSRAATTPSPAPSIAPDMVKAPKVSPKLPIKKRAVDLPDDPG